MEILFSQIYLGSSLSNQGLQTRGTHRFCADSNFLTLISQGVTGWQSLHFTSSSSLSFPGFPSMLSVGMN